MLWTFARQGFLLLAVALVDTCLSGCDELFGNAMTILSEITSEVRSVFTSAGVSDPRLHWAQSFSSEARRQLRANVALNGDAALDEELAAGELVSVVAHCSSGLISGTASGSKSGPALA